MTRQLAERLKAKTGREAAVFCCEELAVVVELSVKYIGGIVKLD